MPVLKQAEALFDVTAQSEIHTSLVILERVTAAQNAAQRNFERHFEVEREARLRSKMIQVADPCFIDAADYVTRECCIRVAVCANDRACF